jgi:hypothetical protein
LPSRARRLGAGFAGVGAEPGVDGVADPAFETAEGFLGGLALGDLLVVVGAAVAVRVADLGDGGHVDGVVEPAVAAQGEPVNDPVAGGHLDRGGAVVGGEPVPGGEPGGVVDVADDQGGDDRADAEDLGQTGATGLDRLSEPQPGLAELGVEVAQVGQELGGDLVTGQPGAVSRLGPGQQPFGLGGG